MHQITNSMKLVLAGFTLAASVSWLPAQASAQDVEAYLRRADQDSDGRIEPHEMSGPIKRYLTSKGYDITERHKIRDVVRRASESKQWKAEAAAAAADLKVPKFGVEPNAKVNVDTFGGASESVEYSEDVNKKTRELFEQYDRNRNGVLDDWEISRMSWGSPRPSTNDKNGDGRLTFQEIQGRYRDREVAKQRSEQGSRDSGRSRGDEERSSGRDERSGGRDERRSRYSESSSRSSTSSQSSRTTRDDSDQGRREQIESYVDKYFESRDLDKNDVLEGDELKKVSSKSRYDKNRDGKVTKSEMLEASMPTVKSTTRTTSTKSSSSRYSKSRSSSKGSGEFTKMDENNDRLVQMHEFSKTWTEKQLEAFRGKDNNGDGVISPEEW